MIKRHVLILKILLLNTLNFSFGQENQNIQAYYTYINYGTNQKYDIKLFTDNTKAISIFNKKKRDSVSINEEDESVNFNKEYYDEEGKQFFIDLNKQQLIFRDFVYDGEDKAVLVSEKLPNLKWILKNETKTVGTYQCYLAELCFRGRIFNVWYYTKINTPFGPWKFHGLPGLIISVKSKDKNIFMNLDKVIISKNKNIEIVKPSNGEEITFDKYKEYKKNEVQEFVKKLQSKLPRGARVTINNSNENYSLEKVID